MAVTNRGAFKKGEKRPYQGRPKGVRNKLTEDVRQMILGALDAAGGQKYLQTQAKNNPTAFLALVGKIVPRDLNVDATVEVAGKVAIYLPDNGRDRPAK